MFVVSIYVHDAYIASFYSENQELVRNAVDWFEAQKDTVCRVSVQRPRKEGDTYKEKSH